MSLEQKIEALTAAVIALTATMATPATRTSAPTAGENDVVDVAPKVKAQKAPKAQDAAASPQPETVDALSVSGGRGTSPEPEYAEVKAALIALSEKHGRELAVEALSRLGVKKATDLDPSMYAKAISVFVRATESGNV